MKLKLKFQAYEVFVAISIEYYMYCWNDASIALSTSQMTDTADESFAHVKWSTLKGTHVHGL